MSIPSFLIPSTVSPSAIDVSKYRTISEQSLLHDLSSLTERFSDIVDSRLTESETDFLLAFQTHMVTVNGDLDVLRRRADTTEADQRREERIQTLKREVDWFKAECVRLNDTVKNKNRENKKLHEKLNGINEELKFLKNLVSKTALQTQDRLPSPPQAQDAPQLRLERPAIADTEIVNKAEKFVEKEQIQHKLLDKELARVRKELGKTKEPETEEPWLLRVFEELVGERGGNKERLTRTDKIEIVKHLLSDEKVLNALL